MPPAERDSPHRLLAARELKPRIVPLAPARVWVYTSLINVRDSLGLTPGSARESRRVLLSVFGSRVGKPLVGVAVGMLCLLSACGGIDAGDDKVVRGSGA
jgi:hypothetical protein